MGFLLYITGRLPEGERQRFEDQLVQDQEFSDAAAICEQELIDSYALNELNGADREAVGLWIEGSQNRRRRVEFARALLKPQKRPESGKKIFFALAAAACLLATVTLYFANRASLERMKETVPPTIAAAPAPQSAPAGDLTHSAQLAKADVILIAAERLRGEQKVATYQVHRGSPLELQVLLPGSTAHGEYSLRVTDRAGSGSVLVQRTGLEARSLGGQLYLSVSLPKGSLLPATYLVTVSQHGDSIGSRFTLRWFDE